MIKTALYKSPSSSQNNKKLKQSSPTVSLDSDSVDDRLEDLNNPLDRNSWPKPVDFTQNDLNQFFLKTLNTNLPDFYKNISFGN